MKNCVKMLLKVWSKKKMWRGVGTINFIECKIRSISIGLKFREK